MTKIEAIIRPSSLDDVVEAIDHEWIRGFTMSEVNGYGRQRGHTELHRGGEHVVDLEPKVKIELVVPTPLAPRILHDLERCLRTGRSGDGKVFVTAIDEAIRIRTGERGEPAL